MNLSVCMAQFFKRDLLRLRDQIEVFSNEEDLWGHAVGMTNSAGNLVPGAPILRFF